MGDEEHYAPWNSIEVNRPGYKEDLSDLESNMSYMQKELRSIKGLGATEVGAVVPEYLNQPEWMSMQKDEFEGLEPSDQDAVINRMHASRMKMDDIQSAVPLWHSENLGRAVAKQPIRPMFENISYMDDTDDEEDEGNGSPEAAEMMLDTYIADSAKKRQRTSRKKRRATKKRRRTTKKRRRTTKKRRATKKRRRTTKKRRRTKRY
jgi:hypothetical protein